MSDSGDVEVRRQLFFRYFRSRLNTVQNTDLPLPDRLILVTACLDALANHWYSAVDGAAVPSNIKPDERLRHFLLRHGQHPVFEKVSAPLVLNATGKQLGGFPFDGYTPGEYNEVLDWNSDPNFDDLADVDETGQLQRRWSYAGMLYVDLRCAWVHRFAPDNDAIRVTDENSFGREEPFYRLVLHGSPENTSFMLVVPYSFLTATLQRALDSFEQETNARNVLPFRE